MSCCDYLLRLSNIFSATSRSLEPNEEVQTLNIHLRDRKALEAEQQLALRRNIIARILVIRGADHNFIRGKDSC